MKKDKDIELKVLQEQDIEDAIYWFTKEKEWQNWDAPWEKDDSFNENEYRENKLKLIQNRDLSDLQPRMEIYLDGLHIGWVSSYSMNDDYVYDKQGKNLAIGIVIVKSEHRSKGYGKKALLLYLEIIWSLGYKKVYLQTWSGNTPMIQLARTIGFTECNRIKKIREVHSIQYDALTYVIEK